MKTSLAKHAPKYPALKYLQLSTEGINLILYLGVDFVKYIILSIVVHPDCYSSIPGASKDRNYRYSLHALEALNEYCAAPRW
jgi:hypothetical protein